MCVCDSRYAYIYIEPTLMLVSLKRDIEPTWTNNMINMI